MECAAKGIGSACSRGPPATRCGLCGAVAYCSKSHQILHWDHHKEECSRLAKQMRDVDVLNDFPFTFYKESAPLVSGKHETRCSILTSMGLHHIGLWKSECSCRPSVASSRSSWIIDNWDLPSSLCPCSEPRNPLLTCLSSWKDYYQWRCLPFHSPVALLLHWPLTVYHCFQVFGMQGLISGDTNRVNIHYLAYNKSAPAMSSAPEETGGSSFSTPATLDKAQNSLKDKGKEVVVPMQITNIKPNAQGNQAFISFCSTIDTTLFFAS